MAISYLTEQTDEALLAAYNGNKDQDSFAELHRRYDRMLRHYYMKRFEQVDDAVAADLCQTFWMRVLEVGHKAVCFRRWLFRQRYYHGCDFFRKKNKTLNKTRLIESQFDIETPMVDARSPSPIATAAQREEQCFVAAALAALDPAQRQILESYFFAGESMEAATGRPSWSGDASHVVKVALRNLKRQLARLGCRFSDELLFGGIDKAAAVDADLARQILDECAETEIALAGLDKEGFSSLDARDRKILILRLIGKWSFARIGWRVALSQTGVRYRFRVAHRAAAVPAFSVQADAA